MGQHLASSGVDSRHEIAAEGFEPVAEIDMALSGDDPVTITKGLGLATSGFAEIIAKERPDFALVLGDRYEILALAQASLLAGVPLIHLCGGDITEGAVDDAIRHSVTKLAHLHFVTTHAAANRVRQLGEEPWRVHVVGSTGIDRMLLTPRMEPEAFFSSINFAPRAQNALVTFHPETIGVEPVAQCDALLNALDRLGSDFGLIFTGTNADRGGFTIQRRIADFVAQRQNAVLVQSLGSVRYYSALSNVDMMIGNSSSGLYEAPSFRIPTVNIGERQTGRVRAASVIDCDLSPASIEQAIQRALALDCSNVVNPYGDGRSSERILKAIRNIKNPASILKKRFIAVMETDS
jgi:UDP-N-acetylglucosamine 2-epimerase (non-hydrolysing)/GDP/UDP-N,N'-diacetylbacillosamine 2-epimerase (hydrolysing)